MARAGVGAAGPHERWTADFKGQFRTDNGVNCYPLTIADQHSRFLLTCHEMLSTETLTAKPVFDAFRQEYNTARPHEALQQETPASHYVASTREYPRTLLVLACPGHFLVKKSTDAGTFRSHKRLLYLANSLVDQRI